MNPIFERQSVRKFLDKEVSETQIENLLKAGMQAPSACNQQAWEFIVINDKKDMIEISEMHRFAKPAGEASKLIVVLGNLKEARLEYMIEQDLGACCENILLQATYEGLGAVWLGFHPIEDRCLKIRKYLNIPDYCIPFAVICVGYPAIDSDVKLRYDDVKVHYGRY
ncbi:MAG: nitroreductase family protein [Methanobrevibacter sp.]|uniref:nitroreductase family protein n=1 Tax=Methanobrevibacter sp. TaxID=66852 RepID=UPI0025EFDB62|nr:nitroreductase family protein [Methanobrevibacter sp.]MBR0270456.1 nitroreductase family protein [Methanobrevibacter sp.]